MAIDVLYVAIIGCKFFISGYNCVISVFITVCISVSSD